MRARVRALARGALGEGVPDEGGRVADVEGVPGDPNTVYVGSASGGIWKTTNGGYSWKPIFEDRLANGSWIAPSPFDRLEPLMGTGNFTVKDVPAGAINVTVKKKGVIVGQGTVVISDTADPTRPVRVDLQPPSQETKSEPQP